MENNKLITACLFILEQSKKYWDGHIDLTEFQRRCEEYANFLSQPLTLGMFVPCVDGDPILTPEQYRNTTGAPQIGVDSYEDFYNDAKERVIFEGFQHVNADGCHSLINDECQILFNRYNSKIELFHNPKWNTIRFSGEIFTVENIIPLNITLTPTALKMIYGVQK